MESLHKSCRLGQIEQYMETKEFSDREYLGCDHSSENRSCQNKRLIDEF
jgi:hypothetical protein